MENIRLRRIVCEERGKVGIDTVSPRLGGRNPFDIKLPVKVTSPRKFLTAKTESFRIVEKGQSLGELSNALSNGRVLIEGLKERGIEAKPFCIHRPKAKEKNFTVHGHNFKWQVISIKAYKKILGMPKKEWDALVRLEKSGMKHNGIYVAAPLKGNAVKTVKAEVKAMCQTAVMKAVAVLAVPLHIAAEIADALAKDPVLLVKFSSFREGDLFIELGRWE